KLGRFDLFRKLAVLRAETIVLIEQGRHRALEIVVELRAERGQRRLPVSTGPASTATRRIVRVIVEHCEHVPVCPCCAPHVVLPWCWLRCSTSTPTNVYPALANAQDTCARVRRPCLPLTGQHP